MTTEQRAPGTSAPDGDHPRGAPSPPPSPASNAGLPPPAYLEELKAAADRDEASFSQMFIAGMLARDPRFGAEVKNEVEGLIPRLLRAFESRYGNIIDSRYGYMCPAGAVLLERVAPPAPQRHKVTGRGSRVKRWFANRRITPAQNPAALIDRTPRAGDLDAFVWWKLLHFDSQDATELLAEILSLRDRITTFLPDPVPREADARDIGVRRLYAIATELTESVDSEEQQWLNKLTAKWYESVKRPVQSTNAGVPVRGFSDALEQSEIFAYRDQHKDQRPSSRFVRGVASLRTRLVNEEIGYLAAVQRVAQHAYMDGMFKGFACLLVVLAGLAVATGVVGFDSGWFTTGTLGAVGAVLSVLQRLGRGLDLAPEGEKYSFKQQGFVRPWIGALLGIASFVLLKGGLVSIAIPSGTADTILYYGGIAFLAGFSERFAQDMLVVPATTNAAPRQAGS
jgi:hypothetical protein